MLPELGMRVPDAYEHPLRLIRVLEGFEGPILSEFVAELPASPGTFLEKYCTESDGISRWLVVLSAPASIEDYLAGEISMKDLLYRHADIAMLLDRRGSDLVARWLVKMVELPEGYLPKDHVFHDPELTEND